MEWFGLDPSLIRIDTMRTGNMVNQADSAVNVTYIPTGDSVLCQEFNGQHRNRREALRKLSEILG